VAGWRGGYVPGIDRWNHNANYYSHVLAAMPRPCEQALDVGCGDGSLVRLLKGRADRVVGIDSNEAILRVATSYADEDDRSSFVEGDFLTQNFGGQSFDFIVAVAALHHMPLNAALSRVIELLCPGGRLYIVGLATSSRPLDYLFDIGGSTVSRVVRIRRGWWRHGSPEIDPLTTYADTRAALRERLPGCVFRRRLYFRYTTEWTRPT